MTVTILRGDVRAMLATLPDESVQFPDGAFVLPTIRPFALICDDDRGLQSESVSSGGASIYQGRVQVLLEASRITAPRFGPKRERRTFV